MNNLQPCTPGDIRAGDRINHAGAVVTVNVAQERWNTFRFDISYEYGGGGNWIFVAKDATVLRYGQ